MDERHFNIKSLDEYKEWREEVENLTTKILNLEEENRRLRAELSAASLYMRELEKNRNLK